MSEFTEAELAALSEEERKAIMDAEADPAPGDKPEADPTPGEPVPGEGDLKPAEGEPKPAESPDPGEEAKPGENPGEAPAAVDPAPAPESAPADPVMFSPKMATGEFVDFAKAKAELKQKYDDGDIDVVEFVEESSKLAVAQANAEFAEKYNQASADQRWETAQGIFWQENLSAYEGKPVLVDALDGAVKRLARDSEFIKSIESAPSPEMALLREAHKQVMGVFGGAVKPAQAPAAAPNQADAPQAKPKSDPASVPPNLASLPVAGAEDPGQRGEFDHLDKMGNEEREAALAKMSPEQMERYLAGK